MSCSVYLRSKLASEPTILNTKKPTDASMFTQKVRHIASQDFSTAGNSYGTTLQSSDMSYGGMNHAVTSNLKNTGRPGPASAFTAYRGSQAVNNDAAYNRGLIVNPTTMTPAQCALIDNPVAPPQSVSDLLRRNIGCKVAVGEQHDPNTLGPRVFVDNTIRNQGDPGLCTARAANHSYVVEVPHTVYSPKPSQGGGQYALKGNLAPGKDVGAFGGNPNYKVGAALARPQNFHISKKDTNVKTTSAKPVPSKYQIPAGAPAHLKINDPQRPGAF
jgi:hypothetical protein